MTDWSGRDYAEVSGLQRTMVNEAIAGLEFSEDERVLDVGCGDGFLIRAVAGMVPGGYAVGADASPRMIATAHAAAAPTESGPWFVVADARRLPFGPHFDAVVSFNALHWVREQQQALAEIASVLHPGGRVLIQVVCAGQRASLESVAMSVCHSPPWARWFDGFVAPFVHVDPAAFGDLAASAGLTLEDMTVTDRNGISVPGPRLSAGARSVRQPGPIACRSRIATGSSATRCAPTNGAGRQGLFRFTQMRATLRR